MDGSIIRVGNNPAGYGKFVQVLHANDMSTIYAHLEDGVEVSEGQRVAKGQLLGYCDNTGNAKDTPPHVRFEIREPSAEMAYGKPVDPAGSYEAGVEKYA